MSSTDKTAIIAGAGVGGVAALGAGGYAAAKAISKVKANNDLKVWQETMLKGKQIMNAHIPEANAASVADAAVPKAAAVSDAASKGAAVSDAASKGAAEGGATEAAENFVKDLL